MLAPVENPLFLEARIEPLISEGSASLGELKRAAASVIASMPELPPAATDLIEAFTDAGELADMISANVASSLEEKQGVLEELDVGARVKRALELLGRIGTRCDDDPARAARSLVVLPIDEVLFPTRFMGGATEQYP